MEPPDQLKKHREAVLSKLRKLSSGNDLLSRASPLVEEVLDLYIEAYSEDRHGLSSIQRLAEKVRKYDKKIDDFVPRRPTGGDDEKYMKGFLYTPHVDTFNRWLMLYGYLMEYIKEKALELHTEIEDYLDIPPKSVGEQQKMYYKFRKRFAAIRKEFNDAVDAGRLMDISEATDIRVRNNIRPEGKEHCKKIASVDAHVRSEAIVLARKSLNRLKEDFFKFGEHVYGKRTVQLLLLTALFSLGALIVSLVDVLTEKKTMVRFSNEALESIITGQP